LTYIIKTSIAVVAIAMSQFAHAEQNLLIDEVVVTATSLKSPGLDKKSLQRKSNNTNDTAKLLDFQPGVSLYGAGGVSSMPAIHGMADDRVRIKVDGMDLVSACANHMNSPLSYIDPSNIEGVKVFAGITPVSVGGDSIGGTIQVKSSALEFAEAGGTPLAKGELTAFYRSNNQAQGGHVSAALAGESVSMRYNASTVQAKNYLAGGDFKPAGVSTGSLANVYLSGDEVGSSQYQSTNQSLALGMRLDKHLIELTLGSQNIPYQGFPNQYMDMLKNDSQQINLNYTGQYDWGKLQARAYDEHTMHYMNSLEAKLTSAQALGMPMNTDGKNTGLVFKGDVELAGQDILRLGSEYQRYRLNDWWSSAPPSMMMSPNTFWNINNGQRDRLAVFAEWQTRWSPQWVSQLGLRNETVTMNTGTVQGYNSMAYGNPSSPNSQPGAFNAADRQRQDNNIDVTILTRFTPNEHKTVELGFAQKTRSPNLHERFTWSTGNSMVMHMNNWFGDGNGYVGNLNLKPEVARTLSSSVSWHSSDADGFEVKVSPYYTLVENYIDAERCKVVTGSKTCTATNLSANSGFVNLQFVNQSAQLYGTDISAHLALGEGKYGKFSANGVLNYVQGKNLTTGDNLYHIMPLNVKLGAEQRVGNWRNTLEVRLVSAKTNVATVRNELQTSAYGLLNVSSSCEWKQLRLDMGIENLLDKLYADPMGGSYLGQRTATYGTSVPGMGRSINTSVTLKF